MNRPGFQNSTVPSPRAGMTARRVTPRILYCSLFHTDKATGGAEIRSLHILRALQQIGEVEVVALISDDAETEQIASSASDFKIAYAPKVRQLPNKRLGQKLKWMLNPTIHYPHGRGVEEESEHSILRKANECDLVWFYKLRTANMFSHFAWPHSVVDVDDVPSGFEMATLQQDRGWRDSLLSRARIFSWRRREKLLAQRFTVLSVCSETDKRYLSDLGVEAPIHVIPNGFERPTEEPVRKLATPPRVGFTGIFDHGPNADGIRWFVDKCWPRIKREVPNARLRLAGRFSDGPLKPPGPDIDGLGWVEDLDAEVATWSVMVIPILVGAGTRIKIAFGFSRKCPVVSTSLGAYGYEVRNGEELFLADAPDIFADACLRVIQRPDEAAEMAERARQKFLENWTWEAIQPRIWAAAEDCLRRSANGSVRIATPFA
jgi:glycosyltransferase involved in cell wall biosynthesis